MSRKYKFRDNDKLYFVSFATVNWIDIFVRNEYRDILLDSLRYCIRHKGLELYAWCIMTSHVHLIIGSRGEKLEVLMKALKSHTSRELNQAIKAHPAESRREWILSMFEQAGRKNPNNTGFQFWQQHNQPIELFTNEVMQQKLDYLHNNPVEAGFVNRPEDYVYSSALDYTGEKGLIEELLIIE